MASEAAGVRVRPTPAGAAVALALGGLLVAYAWLARPELLQAAAAVAGLATASWAMAELAASSLAGARVERAIEPVAGPARVRVRLAAPLGVPPALARLRDAPPPKSQVVERPGAAASLLSRVLEWEYTVYLLPGRWCWGRPRVEARDPLSLFRAEVELAGGRECFNVAPRLAAAPQALLGAAGLQLGRPRAARGFGTSFLYIRDYTPDDDPRFIEWKSVARTGRLAVKVFEREEYASAVLVVAVSPSSLDGVPGTTAYEYAVEAAAQAGQALATAGLRVDVAACGGSLTLARRASRGSSIAAVLSSMEPPLAPERWEECLRKLPGELEKLGGGRRGLVAILVGDRPGVEAAAQAVPERWALAVEPVEGPVNPRRLAAALLARAAGALRWRLAG